MIFIQIFLIIIIAWRFEKKLSVEKVQEELDRKNFKNYLERTNQKVVKDKEGLRLVYKTNKEN